MSEPLLNAIEPLGLVMHLSFDCVCGARVNHPFEWTAGRHEVEAYHSGSGHCYACGRAFHKVGGPLFLLDEKPDPEFDFRDGWW